jgi:hypothetical protein
MHSTISYRRVILRECSTEEKDFLDLYYIFRATLKPDLSFREFRAYYYSAKLEYIDISFILSGNRIIGFCSAAFYSADAGRSKTIIGRAATGILEAYRGRALPKWKLYCKYIRYWGRHPFRSIILSAYVANPLIYAMICKYTGIAYPHPASPVPAAIIQLKDELLRGQRIGIPADNAFVVPIHFSVALGEKERQRIFTSRDPSVGYFVKINPKFLQRYGVLVIIPVNLKNILWSSWKFLYYKKLRPGVRAWLGFPGGRPLGAGEINFN